MFYTVGTAEIPIPAPIASGIRCWTTVKLALRIPFFLVSFFTNEEPHEFGPSIVTIFCVYLWEVTSIASEHEITQLARLIPVAGVKPGKWRMETISEIWIASEPGSEAEETALIYVTDTDSRYVDNKPDIDEARLTNRRIIFPVPRPSESEG